MRLIRHTFTSKYLFATIILFLLLSLPLWNPLCHASNTSGTVEIQIRIAKAIIMRVTPQEADGHTFLTEITSNTPWTLTAFVEGTPGGPPRKVQVDGISYEVSPGESVAIKYATSTHGSVNSKWIGLQDGDRVGYIAFQNH